MYYGELRERGIQYSFGHHMGSVRAFDSAISDFEHCEDDVFTKQEVIDYLKFFKTRWLDYEALYGFGEDLCEDSDE